MNKLMLIILVTSCTTTRKPEVRGHGCPLPTVVVVDGQEWTERDQARLAEIQRGCERKWGKYSCLSRLTKVRPDGYTATCKLMEEI